MTLMNKPGVALLYASLLVISGLLAIPAHAIVNIENIRVEEPKDGISSQINIGINGDRGNTDKISAAAAAKLNWRQQRRSSFLVYSQEYGKSNDIKDTDKSFLHLRYIKDNLGITATEIFTQYQDDEFKRLSGRVLVGAGLRFVLSQAQKGKRQSANIFGLGAFRSNEDYNDSVISGDRSENAWRANFYWVYKTRLNAQLKLANTIYLQPDVSEFDDVRLFDQFALQIKMTEKLSLQLNLDISHDSKPPTLSTAGQSLDKTDISYSTSFVYNFN